MSRPPQAPPPEPLTSAQIARAAYVGSAEHKTVRWWGGLPQAYADREGIARRPGRQDTTICPLIHVVDREKASCWVRCALTMGQFLYIEGDQTFPKKIWYKDVAGKFWFGFCFNTVQGHYKGWPIEEDECRAIFG